jgi:hypothetical protein
LILAALVICAHSVVHTLGVRWSTPARTAVESLQSEPTFAVTARTQRAVEIGGIRLYLLGQPPSSIVAQWRRLPADLRTDEITTWGVTHLQRKDYPVVPAWYPTRMMIAVTMPARLLDPNQVLSADLLCEDKT